MDEQRFEHITRRDALGRLGVLAGGVLSASVVSGLAGGCRAVAPDSGYALQTLSVHQFELVGALSETIIPTTDTPGARDAGVPAFVDQMLTTWYSDADRQQVLTGLDRLDAEAKALGNAGFANAPAEQQISIVQSIAVPDTGGNAARSELNQLFRHMKELTVVGYYTSEIGATQELRQMPMGEYKADIPFSDVGRAWT
jgi:hypothetical protein